MRLKLVPTVEVLLNPYPELQEGHEFSSVKKYDKWTSIHDHTFGPIKDIDKTQVQQEKVGWAHHGGL